MNIPQRIVIALFIALTIGLWVGIGPPMKWSGDHWVSRPDLLWTPQIVLTIVAAAVYLLCTSRKKA